MLFIFVLSDLLESIVYLAYSKWLLYAHEAICLIQRHLRNLWCVFLLFYYLTVIDNSLIKTVEHHILLCINWFSFIMCISHWIRYIKLLWPQCFQLQFHEAVQIYFNINMVVFYSCKVIYILLAENKNAIWLIAQLIDLAWRRYKLITDDTTKEITNNLINMVVTFYNWIEFWYCSSDGEKKTSLDNSYHLEA